jgi:hypothetical protein
MIRTFLVFACSAVLMMSAAAQNAVPTVQEQVSRISQGSYVSVESKNGNLIKGHLLSSDSTTLEIKPDQRKSTPVSIAYSDIQSVRRHYLTPRAKKTLIITAVVAGSVAGALALVCTAREYGCYDQ